MSKKIYHEATDENVPLLRKVRRGHKGYMSMGVGRAEAELPDGTPVTVMADMGCSVSVSIGGAVYVVDAQDIAQAAIRQWEADGRPDCEPDRGPVEE